MNSPQYYLSIIIPAYNEEMRIGNTLNCIIAFAESQPFITEVLVVDNASSDKTREIAFDYTLKYKHLKCITASVRGKGSAVREGVINASGKYLLLYDADMAVPIEGVSKFLSTTDIFDIIIGSREVSGSERHNEPFFRHFIGRIFNCIVQILILPGINDTQCGFKLFRQEIAIDLFKNSVLNGWSFDVEILFIARMRKYSIIEVPVVWFYGDLSRVNMLLDPFQMLKDIFQIRLNASRGVYE